MSRVSGCLWLAVGLILALVAGGVSFITLQRASAARAAEAPLATTDVVVAVRAVSPGTVLQDADLGLRSYPAGALPEGAIKGTNDATGRVSMVQLAAGEMVLSHHLTKPDVIGGELGFTLPDGQVGVTLAASDLLSRIEILEPGDSVDLYYSLEIPATATGQAPATGQGSASSVEDLKSFGTLQNITIANVVRGGSMGERVDAATEAAEDAATVPMAYVLALPPQDALVVKYLKDAGATMDLAIRNTADDTQHETTPVDLPYMIDRFQLNESK